METAAIEWYDKIWKYLCWLSIFNQLALSIPIAFGIARTEFALIDENRIHLKLSFAWILGKHFSSTLVQSKKKNYRVISCIGTRAHASCTTLSTRLGAFFMVRAILAQWQRMSNSKRFVSWFTVNWRIRTKKLRISRIECKMSKKKPIVSNRLDNLVMFYSALKCFVRIL